MTPQRGCFLDVLVGEMDTFESRAATRLERVYPELLQLIDTYR
jgi:hypothetical protein